MWECVRQNFKYEKVQGAAVLQRAAERRSESMGKRGTVKSF